MLRISCENKIISISVAGRKMPGLGLSLANVYALDSLLANPGTKGLLAEGIDFRLVGPVPRESHLLYMELLRQILYLHTTHCLYPRISSKAPSRLPDSPEDFEHYLNGLKNIPLLSTLCHCQVLQGHVEGAPVVIASPGPSLDVEHLRRLKGRAYIIATGRALPRLVTGGVIPDFIYVQDTSAQAWEDTFVFEGCPEVLDSVLVANPVGHLHTYAHKARHVYRAWNCYSFERDIMPKIEEIAPSSTSGSFSLALMLGAGEIVFMGNDSGALGEPPTRAAHSLDDMLRCGTVPGEALLGLSHFTLETPQGTAWTTSDYIAALQWLKTRIFRLALQGGIRFHDNSATGFLRDIGLVSKLSEDYSCPPYARKPLPRYTPQIHAERFATMQTQRLTMVRRCIEGGRPVPPIGLKRPVNAVFCNIPGYSGEGFVLQDRYRAVVLDRIDQALQSLKRIIPPESPKL